MVDDEVRSGQELVLAAQQLGPLLRTLQPRIEREQTLPREVVDGLVAAGVFRTHAPRAIGGLEVDALTYFEVVEELSKVDASVGWLAMINCGNFYSWYPEPVARELFGAAEPYAVASGNLAPKGLATSVAGGYRVSGRWAFVSGVPHADWVFLRTAVDGSQEILGVLVPRAELEIVPTWNGLGLRGTGSHDVVLASVFVPAERVSRLEDCYSGPLYKVWFFLIGHAAHAVGIARTALDALVELARVATPRAGALGSRAEVQMALAEAEATLGAARAYVWDVLSACWQAACSPSAVDVELRMRLKLAMTYAVRSSASAVRLVYDAAGPPSVYSGSVLERCFRDIHTATQHSLIQTWHYQAAGQFLFSGGAVVTSGRAII